MERDQYELMYRQEGRHWWYAGMRRISAALLEHYSPSASRGSKGRPEILDAGCGSGGMTRFLERYGHVIGVDFAPEALDFARRRGLRRLVRGSVTALPFADGCFDIVTSFDVLYHFGVADDAAALAELYRVLRPGGILLIRLPAYDWIRGDHDAAVHTRHRYTRSELMNRLEDGGFHVEHASYANFLLFPLAPVKRLLERRDAGGAHLADLWLPPRPFNRFLTDLLGVEASLVSRIGLPWGLSVFAVGRRGRAAGGRARTKAQRATRDADPVAGSIIRAG